MTNTRGQYTTQIQQIKSDLLLHKYLIEEGYRDRRKSKFITLACLLVAGLTGLYAWFTHQHLLTLPLLIAFCFGLPALLFWILSFKSHRQSKTTLTAFLANKQQEIQALQEHILAGLMEDELTELESLRQDLLYPQRPNRIKPLRNKSQHEIRTGEDREKRVLFWSLSSLFLLVPFGVSLGSQWLFTHTDLMVRIQQQWGSAAALVLEYVTRYGLVFCELTLVWAGLISSLLSLIESTLIGRMPNPIMMHWIEVRWKEGYHLGMVSLLTLPVVLILFYVTWSLGSTSSLETGLMGAFSGLLLSYYASLFVGFRWIKSEE